MTHTAMTASSTQRMSPTTAVAVTSVAPDAESISSIMMWLAMPTGMNARHAQIKVRLRALLAGPTSAATAAPAAPAPASYIGRAYLALALTSPRYRAGGGFACPARSSCSQRPLGLGAYDRGPHPQNVIDKKIIIN